MTLLEKIESKQAKICVVGLGYTGLPLAVRFKEAGYTVSGVDTDETKIASLELWGLSYIRDVDDIQLIGLTFAASYKDVEQPDIIFICVPTPLDGNQEPDLSYVQNAARAIGENLRPGQLVILQSTVYPGVTEDVVKPYLEKAGVGFHLAYSPERINPGDRSTQAVTRVVGGLTLECAELAAAILSRLAPAHIVSSLRVAEMAKLYENVFRNVNIAFANEMAILCDQAGIDAWEVIEAASSKPFGFMPFYPGPGVGGHCIPVNPYYLKQVAAQYDCSIPLVEMAMATNEIMAYYVIRELSKLFGSGDIFKNTLRGKNILLLGASFKPDVEDARHSPAAEIAALLWQRGVTVTYNDPHVPELAVGLAVLESQKLTPELLAAQDCVVVVQAHSSYDFGWIAGHAPLVLDTRNVLGGEGYFYKVTR